MDRHHSAHAAALVAGVVAVLFSCSSDPDSGDSDAASAGSPSAGAPSAGSPGAGTGGSSGGASFGGGPGQTSVEVGRIDVTVTAPSGDTGGAVTFVGKFYASAYPVQTAWKLSEKNGDCSLLTPVFPFCDPGCGAAVCVEDDECVSYPSLVNAGPLTVEGLTTQAGGTITVEPLAETNLTYQPKASAGLKYPGTTPGVPLVVKASSGAYGAFELEAEGILPFALETEDEIRVASGEATHLAWTTSKDSKTSRIGIELEISHHGGVKGQVVCDVPDTGSFDVPAALVTKLIGLGVSGFPTVIVTRTSRGSAAVPMGHVSLIVSSRVDHPVTIPGLVSCSTDADCTGGQKCQQDKQCK